MTMKDGGVKFKNYRCFKDEWAGFDEIKPVNVIIGKNNSGKSCLLDLLHFITEKQDSNNDLDVSYRYSTIWNHDELESIFSPNRMSDHFNKNLWDAHGSPLIGSMTIWNKSKGGEIRDVRSNWTDVNSLNNMQVIERQNIITGYLKSKKHRLSHCKVIIINAERDISPEVGNYNALTLDDSGNGATNIIQCYITDSNRPRELIQNVFRTSLNDIVRPGIEFAEIVPQYISKHQKWEIYFSEKGKGLIPLSKSGSGIKTIIHILLCTLVVPKINKHEPSGYVYIIEEPENHLHPALLRNVFRYLEEFAINNNTRLFITTHSSVALDVFASSENAQIVLVEHDGEKATTRTVSEYFGHLDTIRELGARPSDLLQANGIVWVEGPSDRIYFNKWIEIMSKGQLREGRDYQCAFYGGSLLARIEVTSPDESSVDKSNILTINSNVIFICDGDRTETSGQETEIKSRVINIRQQLDHVPNAYIWITTAKEVESYIPKDILEDIWEVSSLPQIAPTEPFWSETKGYFQTHCPKKTVDKVKLALDVIPHLTIENLSGLFEWKQEMEQIFRRIASWNEKQIVVEETT